MIKINDQLEVLKRLNRFSQCFGRITTIEELAESVSLVLDDLLDVESSGLYLYDFQENRLKFLVAKWLTEEERAEADRTAMERHPGYVFKTGQPLDIPDTENDTSNISKSSKRSFIVRSRLYFPVLNGNKTVGVFGLVSSQKNRFNEEYKVVLSFMCNIAGEIYATLVNNAELRKISYKLSAFTRKDTIDNNLGIPLRDISSSKTSSQYRQAATAGENLQYDLTKLSKLLGDDQAEIIDLVGKFIELMPEYSEAMFVAFEQNNIEDVAKTSHKIKASLELLASGNLRSNIKLINEYARNSENLEKLPKLVKYYRENVPVLLRQLSEKLAEMKNVTRDA